MASYMTQAFMIKNNPIKVSHYSLVLSSRLFPCISIVLFLLSYSCCLIPAVLFLLSCSCCLVPAVLFLLSYSCCLIPAVLFLLSYSCYLIPAVLFLLSYYAVLSLCSYIYIMIGQRHFLQQPSLSFMTAEQEDLIAFRYL